MPGPVFLQGDTVELRTIEEEDIEFLQGMVNDPRVRGSITAVDPVTRGKERDWVASLPDNEGFHFLVCVDAEPVGTVGLKPPNEVWGTAEVGYLIAPEHWGNGYATDAVTTVCGYAFEEQRLNKVYATCS